MSILVTFFGGQPERVRRCLETGGWPPKELPAGSTEEVGFKFYVLPEEALNALVTSATALARTEPFRFESSVAGLLAPDGESFVGTVGGRFVDLFAEFPARLVPELSTNWSDQLERLDRNRYPLTRQRKRGRLGRAWSLVKRSAIYGTVFAVMLPIFAVSMLIPSIRRERRLNKQKFAERQRQEPPSTASLITALVRICAAAKSAEGQIVYTWTL